MAKLKFWTPEEVEKLTQIVKSAKNSLAAAKIFAKSSSRSENSVHLKIIRIKKGLMLANKTDVSVKKGRPVGSKTKNRAVDSLNTSAQRGVALPGGFVFNFTPKKAEMYDNHVRLYF